MDHYFINTKISARGEHVIHVDGCANIPNVTQRNYLGLYITNHEAINDAKIIYSNVVACKFCVKNEYIKNKPSEVLRE